MASPSQVHDTEPYYSLLVRALKVLCAFTPFMLLHSHTLIHTLSFFFPPSLALYNPTGDLKGSYSLSFLLLLLRLISAPTNICTPVKTPVLTSYQYISLHNEQSSSSGHFDPDATEVGGPRVWASK
jgi:hypothetical protein